MIVEVPRQRNSREENETIKQSQTPPGWEKRPRQLAQKDRDARWTKKNNQTHYGYKDHVKVGAKTKLIHTYSETPASTHDSQEMPGLIAKTDQTMHADSAYAGEPIAQELKAKGVENQIHEKGRRGAQLSETQRESNREKSKTRARDEHVFALMEKALGGIYHRSIGQVRNAYQIGMMNLCYLQSEAPELNERIQTLCLVPGVSNRTAITLVAHLKGLGRYNEREIAKEAGLAPLNHDSGTMRGQRHIQGGNPVVRKVLYMAALVASQHNDWLKKKYQELIKTKAPKVALIAIARKLLVWLNQLLKPAFHQPS